FGTGAASGPRRRKPRRDEEAQERADGRPPFGRRSNPRTKKMLFPASFETGATGLEPATSGVTGERLASPLVGIGRRSGLFPPVLGVQRGSGSPLVATAAFQVRSRSRAQAALSSRRKDLQASSLRPGFESA